MTNVILREINKCSEKQKKAVRDIRNQPSIRKSMFSDHEIALDEHHKWLEKLKNDTRQIVFVVLVEDSVSGVVSVNAIDKLHKKSDWAFHLDKKSRGGLGAALEYTLLEFVFNQLGLEKLNCEVLETNEAVVKLHKKFAFLEEGFRRGNIEKDGKQIGVYLLGLTRADWMQSKKAVLEKYQAVLNKFDINVEYASKN